jgi:hypothetical protein
MRLLRQKRLDLIEKTRPLIRPAYKAHVLSQLPNTIIPSFGELLMTQDFSPIVESASLGQNIPAAMLNAALRKIPEIFTNWRRDLDESLLDIVRQSSVYSGQEVPEATLRYATTIFHCTRCSHKLTYPAVIFHECFMVSCSQFHWTDKTLSYEQSEAIFLDGIDINTVSAANLVRIAYGSTTPLSPLPSNGSLIAPSEVLQFHTAAYYHTVAVLDSLRMEHTTSAKALGKLNPYIKARCECYDDEYGGRIFRWKAAVSSKAPIACPGLTMLTFCVCFLVQLDGCMPHDSGNYDDSFSPLDEEEIRHLPRPSVRTGPSRARYYLGRKRCPLCHVSVQDFVSDALLQEHLRFDHNFSTNHAQNFTANYEPCYLL